MFLSRGAETDVHYTTKSHITQWAGSSLWFLPKPDSWVALITGLQGYQKNKTFVITNTCSQPGFFMVIFLLLLLLLREPRAPTHPVSTERDTHVPLFTNSHSPQPSFALINLGGIIFFSLSPSVGWDKLQQPCIGKAVINNGWRDGFFSSDTVMTCQMI